jgi:hypothetical protein
MVAAWEVQRQEPVAERQAESAVEAPAKWFS